MSTQEIPFADSGDDLPAEVDPLMLELDEARIEAEALAAESQHRLLAAQRQMGLMSSRLSVLRAALKAAMDANKANNKHGLAQWWVQAQSALRFMGEET